MATYDPQKGHTRPKPTADEPAPVDELLDVAAEVGPEPEPEPTPAVPSPVSVADASPAPAPIAGGPARRLPAKKVGVGVAVTAVLFALSWALRRKRRSNRS